MLESHLDQNRSSSLSPEDFITTIRNFSFQQKYFKWQSYLNQQKSLQSQYYQASLQKFVEYYPFNHTQWSQLLDIMLKLPKGKSNTLKMYQVALAKNPRCISLWKKYLDWLMKQLINSDPNYLRAQLQNATKIVGNHYRAGFIFQYYNKIQPNPDKRFQMLRKGLVSPLEDIEKIRQLYLNLIESQEFSEIILQIAQSEGMSLNYGSNLQQTKHILQQEFKRRSSSLYQPTKNHVLQREVFEKKINADQYIPFADSIQNWRQYINFIRQSGNNQFLPSIYERALINQCDNQSLWEQYFLLLENEGNHQRALHLLRFHSLFFRSMSKQLTYYWLQIQQRDNPSHSRQLYLELQQADCTQQKYIDDLQIFLHHIQMQLRSKQFANAKAIYEAVLTVFTTNLTIVSHTVLEYADFSVRYFRDVSFAKKLLQNYFKLYPFSEYLFIGLLQFFEKHVEYKEGTKQAKQISDQFIQYMLLGLKKAFESVEQKQYYRIKKVAHFHMRTFIPSIYLIKGAERKLKEQEANQKKQSAQRKANRRQTSQLMVEEKFPEKRSHF